jgi:hypothetical protein
MTWGCPSKTLELYGLYGYNKQQPKIRPHIHNRWSVMYAIMYIYPMYQHLSSNILFVWSCDQTMPIVWSKNLSSKFDSVTSKCDIALQVTSMWSIIPRRILTSPHVPFATIWKRNSFVNSFWKAPYNNNNMHTYVVAPCRWPLWFSLGVKFTLALCWCLKT